MTQFEVGSEGAGTKPCRSVTMTFLICLFVFFIQPTEMIWRDGSIFTSRCSPTNTCKHTHILVDIVTSGE